MTDSFMDIGDVAIYLKMSRSSVYRLAQQGRIPAVKIASQWRFKKELIDEWYKEQARANSNKNQNPRKEMQNAGRKG